MGEEQRQARSFGAVAAEYDRGRPSYPADAVRWLIQREAATVLEVGAGTGKLTAELVAQGHDVLATEPDEAMLEVLQTRLPYTRARLAGAEELPADDRSVDVVVAAQAFHWFDHAVALPEIARVLKPGGALALVWNIRDERIPWVRRLGALLGDREQQSDPTDTLAASGLFDPPDHATYKHWQDVDRDSLVDLVASRSNISTLEPEARDAKLADVRALYDDYGRGYDGMQLPYVTHCYRARPIVSTEGADGSEGPPNDGTDTETLLIDFR